MSDLARLLMFGGAVLFGVGALLYLSGRVPFLGRLPGDISIERGNFHLYFPLATGLLVSIVLTVVLNLFFRR
jgi:hypothetical protein